MIVIIIEAALTSTARTSHAHQWNFDCSFLHHHVLLVVLFFLSNHFCHLKLSRAVATAGKKENNTLKWLYYRIVLRVSLIYCLFVPCLFDDDNHVPLAYTAAAVAIYLITPLSLLPSIYIYIYIYDFDDYIKIAARYMNTSSLFG